jgi:outer membrane protein assembly factor BamB
MKKELIIIVLFFGIMKTSYSQDDVVSFPNPTHTSSFDSEPIQSKPSVKWEFEMPFENCSNPIVIGDILLVNSFDSDTKKGFQFALNKKNGEQIWKNEIGERMSTPSVGQNIAVYGTKSHLTIALDIKDGSEIWRISDLNGKTCVAPAIVNNKIFFGTHGKEWCIADLITGELIKKETIDNGICCFPSWKDNYVYYTDWDGKLHKQNISNLQDSIIFQTNKSSHVAPTIMDSIGIMTNDNGVLMAINLNTGNQTWHFKPDGKLWRSPSVKNGMCVIITDKSNIYGIEIENGVKKWELKKEGTIYTSASIAGDFAFVSSGDNKLYALNIENGKVLWQVDFESIAGQPFIENRTIYVSSGNKVYALK